MMNYAKGNIAGIVSAFRIAGVEQNDIIKAYNQLIK